MLRTIRSKRKALQLLGLGSLFLLLASIFVMPANAATEHSNYEIENFTVNANLSEQNTVSVTETITVVFSEHSANFVRSIPLKVTIDKEVNGKIIPMTYDAIVTSVFVANEPFTVTNEYNNCNIAVGDGTAFTGRKTLKISYIYDLGDDRIRSYDDVFYSFTGQDMDIERFSFHFTFPKAASLAGTQVFTGVYSAVSDMSALPFSVDGRTVSCVVDEPIAAGDSVALYTRLPAGYFSGTRTLSFFKPYAAVALTFLLFCFALFLFVLFRKTNQTVKSSDAPDFPIEMDSAEVGYIWNKQLTDSSLQALIFWLAENKHLSIHVKDDDFVLQKGKKLSDDAPQYLHNFLDGLFDGHRKMPLTKLPDNVQLMFQTTKNMLASEFRGYKSFKVKWVATLGLVLLSIGILPAAATIGLSGFGMKQLSWICAALYFAFAWGFGFSIWSNRNWATDKKPQKKVLKTALPFCFLVLACITLFVSSSILRDLVPFWIPLVTGVFGLGTALLAALLSKPTEYISNATAQLLQLKHFMEKVEMPELKRLMEDTPDYYYRLLPYAYALNMADRWTKKFDLLGVTFPTWVSFEDEKTEATPSQTIKRLEATLQKSITTETL